VESEHLFETNGVRFSEFTSRKSTEETNSIFPLQVLAYSASQL
jgi:hypothetical protein